LAEAKKPSLAAYKFSKYGSARDDIQRNGVPQNSALGAKKFISLLATEESA
jgi:hypothetical protein